MRVCIRTSYAYIPPHVYDVDQIKLMDDEIELLDTPMINISVQDWLGRFVRGAENS